MVNPGHFGVARLAPVRRDDDAWRRAAVNESNCLTQWMNAAGIGPIEPANDVQ